MPGALRAPAPAHVASQACPRPAQVRRGIGRRGVDGRSDRGRVGRLGRQRGPLAVLKRWDKVPRSSRLDRAGETHLLQLAQSTPPADQARGALRALARELEVWGIVPRIRYETVRCVLKNELTPWCQVQRCWSGLRGSDGSGAGPL